MLFRSLDFYCDELKLVVEVDGSQHLLGQAAKDVARTRYLESRGLRVIRFTNVEVLKETEGVVESIWDEVERALTPALS